LLFRRCCCRFCRFLPLVIGNCGAAVVAILPQRCWRDADGRYFFLRRTMMASSAVPCVSSSTSGDLNSAPGWIIPSTIFGWRLLFLGSFSLCLRLGYVACVLCHCWIKNNHSNQAVWRVAFARTARLPEGGFCWRFPVRDDDGTHVQRWNNNLVLAILINRLISYG